MCWEIVRFYLLFSYHSHKVKDVYLKLHQMVFLTHSVAVVSASRIQFEVITLGREDRWSKITRYSNGYLFSSFEKLLHCLHWLASHCVTTSEQGLGFWRGRKPVRTACVAARRRSQLVWSNYFMQRETNCKKLQLHETTVFGSGYDKDKKPRIVFSCSYKNRKWLKFSANAYQYVR